ncbi:hypothetical protein PInf_015119 [Phytophthora infestans]|nr:hypothetical protein PInf_015119 [Phytophthora infestans]
MFGNALRGADQEQHLFSYPGNCRAPHPSLPRLGDVFDASAELTGRLDASAISGASPDGVDTLFSVSRSARAASPASSSSSPEQFRPPMSFLRRLTSAPAASRDDRAKRKEMERKELLEMILESIASVPKAVERIHTNEKLRQALHQEMGEENSLLHRFFDARQQQNNVSLGGTLLGDNSRCWDLSRRPVSEVEDDVDSSPLSAHPATPLGSTTTMNKVKRAIRTMKVTKVTKVAVTMDQNTRTTLLKL